MGETSNEAPLETGDDTVEQRKFQEKSRRDLVGSFADPRVVLRINVETYLR